MKWILILLLQGVPGGPVVTAITAPFCDKSACEKAAHLTSLNGLVARWTCAPSRSLPPGTITHTPD